jgi:hypothetical protein
MEEKRAKASKKVFVIAGIVVVAVALVFAIYSINSGHQVSTEIATNNKNNSGGGSLSSLSDLVQKVPNGMHEAQEQYAYHAGVNTIDIAVGTENAIIENISVTAVGNVDPMSARFISAVDAALPNLVVGKKIDQVNLPTQVSGSSLTTAAVNSYLHSLYA